MQVSIQTDNTSGSVVVYSLTKSDNKSATCRTTVVVAGRALDALIDTGASKTLLSKAAYDRLAGELGPLQPTSALLHLASGNHCSLAGELELPFKMQGSEYKHRVLVSRMAYLEMLLGVDFLYSHGAKIDLAAGTLTLEKGTCKTRNSKLQEPYFVRMCGNSHVKSKTGVLHS